MPTEDRNNQKFFNSYYYIHSAARFPALKWSKFVSMCDFFWWKIERPLISQWSLVAAGQGFEPRQTESESVVLPLHNRALFFVLCFVTNSIIPRKKKKSIAFPHIFAKYTIFFSDTAHIVLNLLRLIALE